MSISKEMMVNNGVKLNSNAASPSLISGRSSGSTTATYTTTTNSTTTLSNESKKDKTNSSPFSSVKNHETFGVNHNDHVCGYDQINGKCGCRCGHMCTKKCGNIKYCQALKKQKCACYGYRPCRNFVANNCYKAHPNYYASVQVANSWPQKPRPCSWGNKCSYAHSTICRQVVRECFECQNGLPCPWTGL